MDNLIIIDVIKNGVKTKSFEVNFTCALADIVLHFADDSGVTLPIGIAGSQKPPLQGEVAPSQTGSEGSRLATK